LLVPSHENGVEKVIVLTPVVGNKEEETKTSVRPVVTKVEAVEFVVNPNFKLKLIIGKVPALVISRAKEVMLPAVRPEEVNSLALITYCV
jgi:hypothetical protein